MVAVSHSVNEFLAVWGSKYEQDEELFPKEATSRETQEQDNHKLDCNLFP